MSIDERQKKTTDKYRDNYDDIFNILDDELLKELKELNKEVAAEFGSFISEEKE